MNDKEIIASTNVLRVSPDGGKTTVVLRITKPFKVLEHEWSCYATDPETKRFRNITGIDSVQAISVAFNFWGNRMKEMKESGIQWLIDGFDHVSPVEFPIDPYFFLDRFHRSMEGRSEGGALNEGHRAPRNSS